MLTWTSSASGQHESSEFSIDVMPLRQRDESQNLHGPARDFHIVGKNSPPSGEFTKEGTFPRRRFARGPHAAPRLTVSEAPADAAEAPQKSLPFSPSDERDIASG
jgi:hypothetical protein